MIPIDGNGLVYFDLTVGTNKYRWCSYIPSGIAWEKYLVDHESDFLSELNKKLDLWNKMSHTKEVKSFDGSVIKVAIDISEIVCPDLYAPLSTTDRIKVVENKQKVLIKAVDDQKITAEELEELRNN